MTIKQGKFELSLKFDGVKIAEAQLRDYNAVEALIKDCKKKFQ